MSIVTLPKSSSSTTHFCYEKGFFYKIRCGVGNSKLVFIQGHPKTVFSEISVRRGKNCLEFSIAWGRLKISRWLFHSCTIFKVYLIKSLRLCHSATLPTLVFHFCFCGLICSKQKKNVFVERNNFSLVSTVLFFCNTNLIQFSCDGITA